jgi:hypothetical protein
LSLTVGPLTVAPSFGSTILSFGAALSSSPRAAIISLTFCGRSTSESVCVAGEGEAAALALAFPALPFMSEEQPASAAADTSAHATSMSRASFILSSSKD